MCKDYKDQAKATLWIHSHMGIDFSAFHDYGCQLDPSSEEKLLQRREGSTEGPFASNSAGSFHQSQEDTPHD